MAGYQKKFLDVADFYELDTSPTNVDAIYIKPLQYMAVHSGTELGLQTLSLQGVEYSEVVYADLDELTSIGKYTVDPTTNSVILLLTPGEVASEAAAKAYITGILIEYQMETLEYISDDALYTMETWGSDGTFIGETRMSSTGTLLSKMLNYDSEQDVNSEVGPFVHIYRRALTTTA